MKKCLAFFAVAVCAALGFSQKAVLKYNGSGSYVYIERTDLRRYDNNKYVGLVNREVRSFISPVPVPKGGRYCDRFYEGNFYLSEEVHRNRSEVGFGLNNSIPSSFRITPDGELFMIRDEGFPSYRSFPAYSKNAVSPGDKWQAKAERVVDPLNKGVLTKIPVYVEYTYLRDEVFHDEPVYVFSAQWATRYGISYTDYHGDRELKSAQGSHKATMYVSKRTGNALVIRDMIDETFFYMDGNSITFRGTVSMFTEYPPAVDRSKLIPALQRVASLSEKELEKILGDSGTGQDEGAGGMEKALAAADVSDMSNGSNMPGERGLANGSLSQSGEFTPDSGAGKGSDDALNSRDEKLTNGSLGDTPGLGESALADGAGLTGAGAAGTDGSRAAGDTSSASPAGDAGFAGTSGDASSAGESGTSGAASGSSKSRRKSAREIQDMLDSGVAGGSALALASGSSGARGTASGGGSPAGGTGGTGKSGPGSGESAGLAGDAGSARSAGSIGSSGSSPSSSGASVTVESTDAGIRLTMQNLKFKPDSADLLGGESTRLDQIAEVLKLVPDQMILIEGHTASTGNPTGEMNLSIERAQSIAREMARRGVKSESIITKGSGGTKPVASNSTPQGKAQNRRVEITILE